MRPFPKSPANRRSAAASRRPNSSSRPSTATGRLEHAKNIATIFSAVAIPIVLTVAGYFIQKQLSEEGLRKDYVGIATAILKENAKGQEPELRAWAVKVLDENSPVPFSKKAKEGLFSGAGAAGPIWIGPPNDCMRAPPKRTVMAEYKRLAKDPDSVPGLEFTNQLVAFANSAAKQEYEVELTAIRLSCVQRWAREMEKSDIEYRLAVGAPSSKEVLADIRKAQAASQPASKANASPPRAESR